MPLLQLDDVEVRYGQIYGTHAVSFTVDEREILALVGSNGAGKSSTLKAILGMVRVSRGEIRLDGASLKGRRPWDVVRYGIGYSPEGRRVFPALSVLENLRVGGISRSGQEVGERLEQVLTYFPRLRERARQRAGSLSGGEQQMLAIGRALMAMPRVFLLDEPSLGVAPVIVDRIGEVLLEIQEREGMAVVLAEQNAAWALELAHRAVILELGRVALEGPSSELRDNPQVQSAYLGF